MSLSRRKTMFPIMETMSKYGPSRYNGNATPEIDSVADSLEYIYADDPKDGNDSSADDDNTKPKLQAVERNSDYTTKSIIGLDSNNETKRRAQSAKSLSSVLENIKEENDKSSDEDEAYYTLPWRLFPSNVLEDLEFFKHADNKLQEELLKTTQLVYINQDGKGMVPRLREPRSLYAVAKELGPQQAARWPSDIQVIPQRIKHIEYCPPEPEPFYRKTGLEKTPMVRGEERGGRLVYQYEPRSTFFVRSRVGGIRTGPEKCAISIDRAADDTTLIFESRFESGNLAKAIQVGDYEYELWLRYDLYTSKHTQWFYFSIQNTRPNVVYRFSIVNFMKPDSLYNYGMKPIMYSEKDALQKKIGWRRCGHSVKYYRNNLKYDTSKGDRPFYSMTWTTDVPHKGDTVYFSHCFPYTYTDLQDYLLDLSNDPVKSKICKQRVLCRTLAGNLVYVLTITSPSQNPEDIKHKKAVVLTARVHPGESNSSWMMKGFLDYLCSNSADAKLLRDTFIFKIVPMLNPDGVIVGNYRCSLAGRDLNRNYKTVLKDSYPSVWHTKQMIRRLLQERDIVAYCDLHGHSRKQNVFIYGCENRHNPQRRLRERIFPCMLGKNSPGKFSFDLCRFKVQKSKEGTGRVVMWNMGILNSYTMEATFCGSSLGKKKGFHFTAQDFEAMGYDFCDTLLDYCDPDTSKCANVLCDLEENLKKEIIRKLEQKGIDTADVDLSDNLSEYEMESSDGGSDSSVSDGPPVHLQFATQRVSKKKKKLRTKKERDRVRQMKDDASKKDKDRPPGDEPGTNNRKPLSGHQAAHAKQEKLMQLLRGESEKTYLSLKPRKLLETAKCDVEDTQSLATDYLEALTHAYFRNGILQSQAEQARRLQAKGNWLKHGIRGQPKVIIPFHQKNQDLLLAKILGMPSVVGNSFVRVWKDYIQKHKQPPKLQQLNMEDFVRNGMDNPLSPIDRRPRHILEVSAAQQRQQELQQRRGSLPEKSAGSHRSHQHTTDERGMSSRLRAKVPSATYINYDTFKISQMNLEDNPDDEGKADQGQTSGSQDPEDAGSKKDGHHNHRHHRTHSGRKSRMAMHDSEDEDDQQTRPDYVKDPHSHQPPRVSSAKAGGEEMNSAIQSIKDLRQSLVSTATNSNLSPTAGNYIKRLLKEEIRQADEQIDDLTAKLQHNIDEKQKHYDDILEQQDQNSARRKDSVESEKTFTRSAPVSKSSVDKPDRLNRTPSASNRPRKEPLIPKPIRTHTNSTSSIGTSPRVPRETPTRVPVESGKVNVDSYQSLPNSKLKVDTGQMRGRKLHEVDGPSVNINASLKETVAKVNRGINTLPPRRGEPIPNAVVTDLTQVQNQYVSERQGQGQNKFPSNSAQLPSNRGSKNSVTKERSGGSQCGGGGVMERGPSASSSSSHEDNSLAEPRSWSVTNEERLDREPVQRVRSARNSSRQVVGKRLVYKAKYPKQHYPVMHLLKVEGATCGPTTATTQNHGLYVQSPRSSTSSTQISPPIGTPRSYGAKRRAVFPKWLGDGW